MDNNQQNEAEIENQNNQQIENQNQNNQQNANNLVVRADDPLYLNNADSSSAILVSDLLTKQNYTAWSRSMIIALAARDKLSFVNGEIPEPAPNHQTYRRGYVFTEYAYELWNEIKDSFGKSNGPRVYELRRIIYSAKQGSDFVVVYYNKLKRLWDEFRCIKPDPLKGDDNEEKKFEKIDKSHLRCDHCGKRGDVKDGCFKLKGYPEWWPYSNDVDNKGKGKLMANNVMMKEDVMLEEDLGTDNPLDLKEDVVGSSNI
ncbi:hypothetical protein LIER_05238 [Lithospermum erythrorhizon]|uniref:Retrotransposon Copia-like N-terminal domain-containing protein n=1 Tax=Lithospermum erythrorhizon TaxID=34254 RepID=A0AAV3P0E5_LITER